ncbi:MAG: YidC/Oxa1 family membrane protein insertase [Candidatus Woesebacteria bacterium]|jgi:YidC/Oxa1 family membrane protein insertase
MWNTILVNPLLNTLVFLYHHTGSLGISIVILTVIIRTLLIPVILPSIKSMKKQRELAPQIGKLRKKYKKDQQKLAKAQMELFKKHGINPAAGCLSQIAMIIVLIALFGVIRTFTLNGDISSINSKIYFDSIKISEQTTIDTNFWYLDLSKPDPYFILAVLVGLLQFVLSKMTMPAIKRGEKTAKNTPQKSDDLAYNMQQQAMYFMPIMNFIIGVTLPSGVVLYILTTTIFTMSQTYIINGPGGLKPWINKLKSGKRD